jgi:hypothetical protein
VRASARGWTCGRRTPLVSRLLPRPAYPTCSRRTSYRGGWRTGDRQWAAGGGTDPGRRSRSRRSARRWGCGASGAGSPRMSSARLSSARSLLLDDWNICSPGYGALRTEGGVPAQSRWSRLPPPSIGPDVASTKTCKCGDSGAGARPQIAIGAWAQSCRNGGLGRGRPSQANGLARACQDPSEDQTSSLVAIRSMTASVNSVVPAWPPRSGVLMPAATVSSTPS